MSENSKQVATNGEIEVAKKFHETEYDAFFIFSLIFKHKWLIIIFSIVVTIAAAIYAFNQPNWYSSKSNLVPPKNAGSMMQGVMSNITSTLKEFGMTKLGGSGGDGAYSYMVILQSRTVKDSIIKKYNLAKSYGISPEKISEVRDEFDNNLDITYEKEGNYTITITDKNPDTAAIMVKDFVSIANDLAVKVFSTEATLNRQHLERRIEQTDSVLAVIADSLQQSSRKNLMFDPESQAKAVSTALIDMNAEKIKQEVVLELLKDRYGATDSYTKMQENIVNQLAQHLNDAKNKPGFAGEFSLRDAGKIGIQYMNYYVLYETFSKVRSFLMPMLEEARLDEMKQVQNLYIIDEPTRPDKKSRPKRSLFIAGALFGSFVFSIMIVIVTDRILIFRKKLNDYYA